MPGVLVADEMGLGKTLTSVAAATLSKLLTAKIVVELPQTILCGNTLGEWVNKVQNNNPGFISKERESSPLQ